MDALMSFIMGSSTTLTVDVAIRLAITFAIIDMLKCIIVQLVKGAKG